MKLGRKRREAAAAEEARVQGVRDEANAILNGIGEAFATAKSGGDAQLRAVYKEIKAAEDKAYGLLWPIGCSFSDETRKELRGIYEATRCARDREKIRETVRSAWKTFQDRSFLTTGGRELFVAYETLGASWRERYVSELEIDREQARDELRADLQTLVADQWPRIMHDAAAWRTLRPLVADQWAGSERHAGLVHYAKMGIEIAVDAETWNLATVYHNQNPSLSDFIGAYDPDMKEGVLLHMAAEALRDRSFLKAKIVLAYSKHSDRYFRELGDPYRKELADMIAGMERIEMALRLTYIEA